MKTLVKKYIGDKKFYKKVLTIAVPIMIQNGFTNFVNLLDNIMVGRVGTEQMSGVSIVNTLVWVYILAIFGGLAGAGIFTAQYYGSGDNEGIRHTFRYKLILGTVLTALAIVVFSVWGKPLIGVYLSGESGDLAATLQYGLSYLKVIFWGLPAYMLVQVYASTLRECGETIVPMKAGVAAVLVNLVFNYLLIYGKFGFPELGVVGAAIATNISRFVEAGIVVYWTHKHSDKNPFIVGMYKTLKVPMDVVGRIIVKGMPLLANESLWSIGIAFLTQCYSTRGLNVIAGINIANTINNVFNIVFIALGDTVAILVGQLLGAGKMEEAKDTDNKLIFFSVSSCLVMATIMFAMSGVFPKLYNTNDEARYFAMQFIMMQAVFMPQNAFTHATYFTLRSGGKTLVTFLFDSAYVWAINVPVAFLLSRYTGMAAIYIFICVNVSEWIKCIVGFVLVKKNVWMNNMVANS